MIKGMASSKVDNSYMEELLTCSVCLDVVSEPHTLAQCLHNYCKPCVQQLLDKQANPSLGVVCPLCRKFSSKDDIKPNHFVKELLALHQAPNDQGTVAGVACEKCEDSSKASPSNWRCVDCRVYMCDACTSMHSHFIKGHRLLELTEQTQLMIDQLLFCTIHTDEPIKFYCNQCNKMLCITCHVVTHRNHDIVTIEDALEKMLPNVKEQVGHLDETIEEIEEAIQRYIKEEEGTKTKYQQSRQEVDKAANERVEEIKKEQQRLEDDLTREEENQIQQITRNRCELINKKKEISNLRNVSLASIEHAQHVSLLGELVQGGLYERLEKVNMERLTQTLSLNTPKLVVNQPAWNKLKTEGLIGTINNNVRQMTWSGSKQQQQQHAGGKYFAGNFTEVLAKPMTKVLEIPLRSQCQDLLVHNDKIWVPLRDKNSIHVYTEEGQLGRTIDIAGGPTCIDRTSEGAVLVSCHQKGMYELVDGKKPVLIDSGSYCDFCISGDGVFVLDYKKYKVIQLKKECGQWTKYEQMYFGNIAAAHERDTLVVSGNRLDFFMSSFWGSKIFKLSVHGEILQQYEADTANTNFFNPGLCAMDSFNQLLVVQKGGRYTTLNTLTMRCCMNYHTDRRLLNIDLTHNGTMWMCSERGITKLTL